MNANNTVTLSDLVAAITVAEKAVEAAPNALARRIAEDKLKAARAQLRVFSFRRKSFAAGAGRMVRH